MLTTSESTLTLRQPTPGPIIHADRGSQYTSPACGQFIADTQAQASYVRPGNLYNNAQAKAG